MEQIPKEGSFMAEAYRPKRRKKKKWSAKRWRFELTRIALLLAMVLVVAGLVEETVLMTQSVSDIQHP